MIQDYKWRDQRNAVGFAAACTRESLKYYQGSHREEIVATIEIAEQFVAGEKIDHVNIADFPYAASYTGRAAAATIRAAVTNAVAHTVTYATYVTYAAAAVYVSANAADRVGVNQHEIDILRCVWIVKDLGLIKGAKEYQAALAALSAGSLITAEQIAGVA